MSLHYIIDAYNIINHPQFIANRNKKIEDTRIALLELIETSKLCGSRRNKITVVFDGYFDLERDFLNIDIVFSRSETADNKINKMVELSSNPKNIIVVSDDKDIKFFVKPCGAISLSIEDFMAPLNKLKAKINTKEQLKPELSYTQISKINQELRKIWLERQA